MGKLLTEPLPLIFISVSLWVIKNPYINFKISGGQSSVKYIKSSSHLLKVIYISDKGVLIPEMHKL